MPNVHIPLNGFDHANFVDQKWLKWLKIAFSDKKGLIKIEQ